MEIIGNISLHIHNNNIVHTSIDVQNHDKLQINNYSRIRKVQVTHDDEY